MKGEHLISIALCTYNGEKFLSDQLDSLVNQTYPRLQIVVIDDLSTDNTMCILQQYQQKYPFIEVYQNPVNIGYIKNFERALEYCKGDYITLCDQDDIWKKDKLEKLITLIDEKHILVYHESELINEIGEQISKTLSETIGYISGNSNRALLLNNCIAGHAMLFKKELLHYVFPFPTTIPHDHWIAYIALTIGRVRYFNKVLVSYRQHINSITYTHHLKQNEKAKKKLKAIQKEEKRQRRRIINLTRIDHLNTLKDFKGNSATDVEFIETLTAYLMEKDKKYFSLPMFIFLIKHHSSLFKLYHKSIFSELAMIFKECKGTVSLSFRK